MWSLLLGRPIKAKKPISRLAGKPQTTSARSDVTPSAAAGSNDQSLTASAAAAGELSKELSNFTLSSEPSTVSTSSATTAAVAASAAGPAAAAAVLLPEPYLALQRVNGYTGQWFCAALRTILSQYECSGCMHCQHA